MNKNEVINALEEFCDGYGSSFASVESEAMSIIEEALDMYYGRSLCPTKDDEMER